MNDERWERIQRSFDQQTAANLLGIRLNRVAEGEVEVSLPFRADLCQQHGYVHAGIITTLIDTAAGYAALSVLPPEREVVSTEFKVNLMSPAVGERFIGRGWVVKQGRKLIVVQGEATAVQKDGSHTAIAIMQATMVSVRPAP